MSPWIGIQRAVWAPLRKSWLTIGQTANFLLPKTSLYLGNSSSFSRISIGTDKAPLFQEGNLKTLHLKTSPQGSMDKNWKPPTFPYNFGHHKQAVTGPSQHAIRQHPKRGLYLINLLTNLKYPGLLLKIPLIRMASMWFQLLTCIFRIVELYFPPLECLLQLWHQRSHAWLMAEGHVFRFCSLELRVSSGHYSWVFFQM